MRRQSRDPATHSPKIKPPNLALPPNPIFSASEAPGLRGASRQEPQGHSAEHGLLTHVAGQLLPLLFKDERLGGPQRRKNSPQRGAGRRPGSCQPHACRTCSPRFSWPARFWESSHPSRRLPVCGRRRSGSPQPSGTSACPGRTRAEHALPPLALPAGRHGTLTPNPDHGSAPGFLPPVPHSLDCSPLETVGLRVCERDALTRTCLVAWP